MRHSIFLITVFLSIGILYGFGTQALAQQNQPDQLGDPQFQDDTGAGTPEIEASGSWDDIKASANQGFSALMNRQFTLALQQYEQAAGSNPEYQKMVDFINNILDRLQEMVDEQTEIFSKTATQQFRLESMTREEIDRMIQYQFDAMKAGPNLQDIGPIANIPITELGLDSPTTENLTLAEYLGWVQPRGANERIWYRARIRSLERQLVYAKQEIYQQQRQERLQRIEEFRRRKLERQAGSIGVGGGGFGGGLGGGFGGGGGGFGGFGGGFGGGGIGGGGF